MPDHSTFSFDRVSCHKIGWPQALYVVKDALKLLFILYLLPNSSDYRHTTPCPALYPVNAPKLCLQV